MGAEPLPPPPTADASALHPSNDPLVSASSSAFHCLLGSLPVKTERERREGKEEE